MRVPSRTVAVAALLLSLSAPAAVDAAYTSAISGSTATMTGDVAGDALTITQSGGLFRHNRYTAGDPLFNSDFDFDTSVAGDQTVASATGIININAGDGNDVIALGDGVDLHGAIDGGLGTDTLDYTASTTAVRANLGLGTTGLVATLGGDQQDPPTTHAGTGTATVTNYSVATRTFDITVTVSGLPPGDVTGFHIHQAPVGVNGPIIVDFTGLAPLVPAGTGFTFTANGLTLPSVSEAAFLGGATYVNIHTAAFPGGAIRGQLFSAANLNQAPVATGTTGVFNVEIVTGGAGGDSLVGNNLVNTLNGGGGDDWIVGGPGNDVLNGDAGADVLVWSNGDGTDVMEGGADSDTVQVNGSTAGADAFTVSANGTRIDFDRTNLGLFSLDIGTSERLTVNGIGGNDSFTVNDLSGVSPVVVLFLNGFEGTDSFTFVPAFAGANGLNVHGGTGTDTLQGPNANMIWNVTAANTGTITNLVQFTFIEAFSGGTANDTFNVKAFATGTPAVTGGAGTDTLNYDAESRAISGDTTPPDGTIDSPGVQPVAFSQIETVNIINPQQPTIAISDVTVAEGGSALFNVTLSNASLMTVTVNFATANGTASAPGDYQAQSGLLTFVPGDTLETVSVAVTGDALLELAETFVVNLSGAVNAVIADAQGQGTITDNNRTSEGDFDGDGKAEIAVFRPSTGTWYIRHTATPTSEALVWGGGSDVPVARDYDGDGSIDIAVFRPSTGTWYIRYTGTPTAFDVVWGGTGDVPVPSDFDGDGKTDIAVFRRSTGTWYIRYTATPTSAALVWGGGSDVPVPVDFDGDGQADIAVFRPSTGTWYIRYSGTPTSTALVWGGGSDIPVPVDFDGDGKAEIAVFRPSTGTWYIRYTATPTSLALVWGGGSDVPVPGDYDGDGKAEIAVFRPSTGTWYIRYTATPTSDALVWGGSGDVPILKRP